MQIDFSVKVWLLCKGVIAVYRQHTPCVIDMLKLCISDRQHGFCRGMAPASLGTIFKLRAVQGIIVCASSMAGDPFRTADRFFRLTLPVKIL